jgi:hypothetical protein
MLIEHVSGGIHTHKDGAGITIIKNLRCIMQDPPAGDHVVFVAVMLYMRDDTPGGSSSQTDARIIKMRCGRAKSVDFLWSEEFYQLHFHEGLQFRLEKITNFETELVGTSANNWSKISEMTMPPCE